MRINDATLVPPQGGYFAKSCPRKVWNDLDPTISDELKDPFSEAVLHRMNEGNDFEAHIEARLKDAVYGAKRSSRKHDDHAALAKADVVADVRWLPDGTLAAVFLTGDRTRESKTAREQATMEAMRLGVHILWNPRLPADLDARRIGEPDFMVRAGDEPKSDGRWAYVPGDVKHHKVLDGTARPTRWLAVPLDNLTVTDAHLIDLGRGTPRKEDAFQLAFYTRMLEAHGHALPDGDTPTGLLIGKEEVALVHDLDAKMWRQMHADGGYTKVSALELFDTEWNVRMDVARVAVNNSAAVPVIPTVDVTKRTECAECVWSSLCHTQRLVDDHISRVVGVTVAQTDIHAAHGTRTVADLARLDIATAMCVDAGLDVEFLMDAAAADPQTGIGQLIADCRTADGATKTMTDRRADLAAELATVGITTTDQLTELCEVTAGYSGDRVQRLVDQIDRARVMVVGKPHRSRGVEFVSLSRPSIELHVDIEDNGGFVYLIGVKAFGKAKSGADEKRRSEYHAFHTWETTPEAEAKVVADWWEYVVAMQSYAKMNRWGVKGFCFTHHERSTLLKKAAEHEGFKGVPTVEELTEFFDSAAWVDLHEVVKAEVLFPTEDMKLKTVATKICGFVWRDEDPSGGNSLAWYAEAVDPDETDEVREAARQRLLAYNDDDCHATYAIAEWFSRNGESRRPGATLPGVEKLDIQFRRLRRRPADAWPVPVITAA